MDGCRRLPSRSRSGAGRGPERHSLAPAVPRSMDTREAEWEHSRKNSPCARSRRPRNRNTHRGELDHRRVPGSTLSEVPFLSVFCGAPWPRKVTWLLHPAGRAASLPGSTSREVRSPEISEIPVASGYTGRIMRVRTNDWEDRGRGRGPVSFFGRMSRSRASDRAAMHGHPSQLEPQPAGSERPRETGDPGGHFLPLPSRGGTNAHDSGMVSQPQE